MDSLVLVLVVKEDVGEKPADERTDDPQQDGAAHAHRVTSGYEKPRQRTGNEADDEKTNDEPDDHQPARCRLPASWLPRGSEPETPHTPCAPKGWASAGRTAAPRLPLRIEA